MQRPEMTPDAHDVSPAPLLARPPPTPLAHIHQAEEGRTLLSLSPLTAIHIGRLAIRNTSAAMSLSNHTLCPKQEQSSYVFHVPCRLGHDNALDDAARCVYAAFRELNTAGMSRLSHSSTSITLYTRALRSLQRALYDAKRSHKAETLCATALLGIFEYLTQDPDHAWIHHARGAAQLIKHRGPMRFTTDFEKSLLVSQMGIILTEAFFANKPSFLESEDWMATVRSAVAPNHRYSDRSPMVISLYEAIIPLAAVMSDTTAFIQNSDLRDKQRHESLLRRAHNVRRNFLLWHHRWQEELPPVCASYNDLSPQIHSHIVVNHLSCVSNMLVCNRICFALDKRREFELELEARSIAAAVISFEHAEEATVNKSHITVTLALSRVVLETAEEWDLTETLPDLISDETLDMISPATFRRWRQLMGVEIH